MFLIALLACGLSITAAFPPLDGMANETDRSANPIQDAGAATAESANAAGVAMADSNNADTIAIDSDLAPGPSHDILVVRAINATDKFHKANEDMKTWYEQYNSAIKAMQEAMLDPNFMCQGSPITNLTQIEVQIIKIQDCRREKIEQLGVLEDIAQSMVNFDTAGTNLNGTRSNLEQTIDELRDTANDEDTELSKEEAEILAMKTQIENFLCNCAYHEWGEWSECSRTCGNEGSKSRSRVVKWNAKNGGRECLPSGKTQTEPCNILCCPIDCKWGEWQEWSACPSVCGVQNKTRFREKVEHVCGGLPCEGEGIERQECDAFAEKELETDECYREASRYRHEIAELKNKLCEHVSCQNGGSCEYGGCKCTAGYGGDHCESKTGWYLGHINSDCNTACLEKSLQCTDQGLEDHNGDVDTPSELIALIDNLGIKGTLNVTNCSDESGANPSTPLLTYKENLCLSSYNKTARADSKFSCAVRSGAGSESQNLQRLCWCHTNQEGLNKGRPQDIVLGGNPSTWSQG